MAIPLRVLSSANPASSNTDARPKAQQDASHDGQKQVQYRQLISRAVTQRLHSPSLDDLTKTNVGHTFAHTLEAWEVQERCIARDKARIKAELLAQFVRDVESAALQVHVLTPTRYQVPPRSLSENQEASKQNGDLSYKFGDSKKSEQDEEWKLRDAAVYNMLRALGSARLGS